MTTRRQQEVMAAYVRAGRGGAALAAERLGISEREVWDDLEQIRDVLQVETNLQAVFLMTKRGELDYPVPRP